jgi:hypothetical protein
MATTNTSTFQTPRDRKRSMTMPARDTPVGGEKGQQQDKTGTDVEEAIRGEKEKAREKEKERKTRIDEEEDDGSEEDVDMGEEEENLGDEDEDEEEGSTMGEKEFVRTALKMLIQNLGEVKEKQRLYEKRMERKKKEKEGREGRGETRGYEGITATSKKRKQDFSEEEEEQERREAMEERATKRIRKEAGRFSRKGIELPKMKGDVVTEEAMRRFVLKVKEKIQGEEEFEDIRRDISSALVDAAYDMYGETIRAKYGREIHNTRQLEAVMDEMLRKVTKKRGLLSKKMEVEKRGQQHTETMQMWGNYVSTELGRMDAPSYMIVDAFVNGIRMEKVQSKIKATIASEEGGKTLEEAVEEASKMELYYENRGKDTGEAKKGRSIAPVVEMDAETCKDVVRVGLDLLGHRSIRFNEEGRGEEGRGGYQGGTRGGYQGNERGGYQGGRGYQRGSGEYQRGGRGYQRGSGEYQRGGYQGGGRGQGGTNRDECWNCGQAGHRSFECSVPPRCRRCDREGHKAVECTAPMCDYCGRIGHVMSGCWDKNPELKSQGRGRGMQARGGYHAGAGDNRGGSTLRGILKVGHRGGQSRGGHGGGQGRGSGGDKAEGARIVAPVVGEEEPMRVTFEAFENEEFGDSNKDREDYEHVILNVNERKRKREMDEEQKGKERKRWKKDDIAREGKMTTKERNGREQQGQKGKARRRKKLRKKYRKQQRERKWKREFGNIYRKDKPWINEEAYSMEEMLAKMNGIDDLMEREEKEEEEETDRTIAGVERRKKYTGAMAMITIEGKQIKALIDSGACETIISEPWVRHLGLHKRIDRNDNIPSDLKGASGGGIDIIGSVMLEVKLQDQRKEGGEKGEGVKWKAWVAKRLVVPLIVGNDCHDKRTKLDYHTYIWEYDGIRIPFQIERGGGIGTVATVVATHNMRIPQYATMTGMGKVIRGGGEEEEKGGIVDFTGLNWGRVAIQSGITNTTVKKREDGRREENMIYQVVNRRDEPIYIQKGDIMGFVDGEEDIVGAVYGECNYREVVETLKTEEASSQETKEEKEREEEDVRERSDDHDRVIGAVVGAVEGTTHQDNDPPLDEATIFLGKVFEEALGDGCMRRGESPVIRSGSIECLSAPHIPRLEDTDTRTENGGERPEKTVSALGRGVLPEPCDGLSVKDAETILALIPEERSSADLSVPTTGWRTLERCIPRVDGMSVEEEEKEMENRRDVEEKNGEGEKKNTTDTEGGATDEEIEKMIADAQISEQEKEQLRRSLRERRTAFMEDLRPAGQAYFEPHRIILRTEEPLYTPQHRRSEVEEEIIDKEAMELLKKGVIRRAWTSAYNSPMMVVKKKDGRWRSVIDYRRINSLTIKEPYPIPRADEAFDALKNAGLMTTFDLTWGYWQTPLAEEDKKKTTFTTRSGRWEYNVLPMGITNAAPAFQRNMEAMLSGLMWKKCVIYIDDIIIFGGTFEEHLKNVEEVLDRMRKFNVMAKPSKCKFCQTEVTYLGHRVGKGKLKMDTYNVEKILNMPMPGTLKEIRSFVCLVGYYRRFIKNFATISKPLTELQNKEKCAKLGKREGTRKKFELPEEAKEAVEILKRKITEAPVMALPDFKKPFGMRTDASQYAIGGVLFQWDEAGNEHPIWYASRVLKGPEKTWSASEREMLGIYEWMRYWRPYLWGRPFKAYTDHSPLTGIKTKKDITGRLTNMILKLQEYDYELLYTPGKKNVVADALSREPIAAKEMTRMVLDKLQSEGNLEDLEIRMNGQDFARSICTVIAPAVTEEEGMKDPRNMHKRKRRRAAESMLDWSTRRIWGMKDKEQISKEQIEDKTLKETRRKAMGRDKSGIWVIREDVLYRVRRRKNRKEEVQLVVPETRRKEVMEREHDTKAAGHMGVFKTVERIAKKYWWPGMRTDIQKYVKECLICQEFKRRKEEKKGFMKSIEAYLPFELMGMDILTDLKTTKNGNKHIVVLTDYYTKWPEAFAVPDHTSETLAKIIAAQIFSRHGAPERIITDRGPDFMADTYRQVTELLQMKHSPTTPYHPQTDGQCEKMIGTISGILARIAKTENDWDEQLPFALYAYRGAVHETTRETPFFMVYGRDPHAPGEEALREWKEEKRHVRQYAAEVVERMERARDRVREEIKKRKEAMKKQYDKGREESDYAVGDIVWLRNRGREIGQHHKMAAKWLGPYRIFKVHKDNTSVVEIRNMWNRMDEKNVNIALLKRGFVREGSMIPDELEMPEEEEKGGEGKGEEAEIRSKPKGKSRGRRGGRRTRKSTKGLNSEQNEEREEEEENDGEGEERKKVRNREGRTKYTQAIRNGETKRKEWTKEEEEKEWMISGIVQEIELKDGSIQYRVQFKGCKKLSDARYMDEAEMRNNHAGFVRDWERKKRELGVDMKERKDGMVTTIKRK